MRLFPRSKYAVSLSPFNIKLETWLRIAKVPYDLKHTTKASPKGKSPWIIYNGQAIGDSALIIDFLTREFKVQLDAHLTPEQHAIGHAVRVRHRAGRGGAGRGGAGRGNGASEWTRARWARAKT